MSFWRSHPELFVRYHPRFILEKESQDATMLVPEYWPFLFSSLPLQQINQVNFKYYTDSLGIFDVSTEKKIMNLIKERLREKNVLICIGWRLCWPILGPLWWKTEGLGSYMSGRVFGYLLHIEVKCPDSPNIHDMLSEANTAGWNGSRIVHNQLTEYSVLLLECRWIG